MLAEQVVLIVNQGERNSMGELKDFLDLYNSIGAYCHTDFDAKEANIAISNFYYLSFYINDAIRDLRCICCDKFFQKELYESDDKSQKIHYYHHHINSLFSNIGLIQKYIEEINKRNFSSGIITIKFDDLPRHKIQHSLEDSVRWRNTGHLIHGLNVVIDEEDIHLRTVKDINRLLDLLEYKYYYLKDSNTLKCVDLKSLENDLQILKTQVDSVHKFIHFAWNWH